MLFILSSISSCSEFGSVNHTLIYENSECDIFKNIKFLREISDNSRNDLLRTNVHKSLESFLIIVANNIAI